MLCDTLHPLCFYMKNLYTPEKLTNEENNDTIVAAIICQLPFKNLGITTANRRNLNLSLSLNLGISISKHLLSLISEGSNITPT